MRMNKRYRLLEPDKKLFYYLFKYRTAMSVQIHRDVYKYNNIKITRNRLSKLKASKYINGSSYPLLNRMMAFCVSKDIAYDYINLRQNVTLWKKTYCPYHDLKLLEIWKSLSLTNELEGFYTENEYKFLEGEQLKAIRDYLGDINPDGIMKINIKTNKIMATLEFERSFKSKTRYLELFNSYYENKNIKYVFYICESKRLYKLISKVEDEFISDNNKTKFYYCLSKDIFTQKDINFENIRGEIITLRKGDTISDITSDSSFAISLGNMFQTLEIQHF